RYRGRGARKHRQNGVVLRCSFSCYPTRRRLYCGGPTPPLVTLRTCPCTCAWWQPDWRADVRPAVLLRTFGGAGVPRLREAMRTASRVCKKVGQDGATCVVGTRCQRCQEEEWRHGKTGWKSRTDQRRCPRPGCC